MQGTEKGFTLLSSSVCMLFYLLSIYWFLLSIGNRAFLFEMELFRKKRTGKADSFDARGIVKQYGSEEWGEYVIREAHLSQRFAFDEKGYYHCRASIPFPENMQLD